MIFGNYEENKECQFTLKQLVGYDDKGMFRVMKGQYPSVYCLEAGDYNVYYMPDNTVRTKFMCET